MRHSDPSGALIWVLAAATWVLMAAAAFTPRYLRRRRTARSVPGAVTQRPAGQPRDTTPFDAQPWAASGPGEDVTP